MKNIPKGLINFTDLSEKSMHDKTVLLVKAMPGLNKSLASAQSPREKARLERQIKSTDEGIDKWVYQLYRLSEEEIMIIEGDT